MSSWWNSTEYSDDVFDKQQLCSIWCQLHNTSLILETQFRFLARSLWVLRSVTNCEKFSIFSFCQKRLCLSMDFMWNTYFQLSRSRFSFLLHQSHLLFTYHTVFKLLNLLWATAGETANSLPIFELYILIYISLSTPRCYTYRPSVRMWTAGVSVSKT
jgi:hypothetical protein